MGVLALVLYINSGATNPPQAATLLWRDANPPWQSANSAQFTSPQSLPTGAFTLNMRANLAAENGAWGVWLGLADGQMLVIGINGGQYVTARLCPATWQFIENECLPMLEPNQHILTFWKYFRHIQPAPATNTIQLNWQTDESPYLRLWLNNEWMWDISITSFSGAWGGWQTSPVQWQSAEIWTDS